MRRSAAIAVAAAITGVMAVTGPATASSAAAAQRTVASTASGGAASTWRVAYTDPTLMSGFGDVAAFSGTNIWVAGGVSTEGAPNGNPDIKRWNGKSWATVTLPSKFAASDITRMSASSAHNVWIFGQVRSSTGQNPDTFGLHWNGLAWSQPMSWHTYNTVDAATVIGPKDVWVFGSVGTWHYNGSAWQRYPLSYTITGASAISSTDIWAAADGISGAPKLAHWNGAAWSTKLLPKISSSPPGASVLDVVAKSDANIWVVGGTVSSTGNFVSLALHWAGGAWHQVDPAGSVQLGQVIADGTGGVWAAGSPSFGNSAVFHYSAGTWTSVPMPTVSGKTTSIGALGRVPGTTTLYGAGMLVFGGLPETEGLIVHD